MNEWQKGMVLDSVRQNNQLSQAAPLPQPQPPNQSEDFPQTHIKARWVLTPGKYKTMGDDLVPRSYLVISVNGNSAFNFLGLPPPKKKGEARKRFEQRKLKRKKKVQNKERNPQTKSEQN